jgi:hypothetical protein
MSKNQVDLKYSSLRSGLTKEAAKAYLLLDEEVEPEVVLWETIEVAKRRTRVLERIIVSPGVFITAIYNHYGPEEYPKWVAELRGNIDELKEVDQQG